MRIVHVVFSLEVGGAEVLVRQLCLLQRARGHEVRVCVYARLGPLGETMRAEGFLVQVLGEAHPAVTMARTFRLFESWQPEVVHCHNPAPTLQAALSARLAGVGCVVSTRHSLVAPPYDRAAEVKYGVMALCCDWVVGICEATCANLRGAPLAHREKIVRVYNGASALACAEPEERPEGALVLLFVGRLAAIKDLGTLIRAVALARERAPEVVLWVVGDGPSRGALEAQARELGVAEAVCFCGQQMQPERFFAAADVFAMSSVSEGLPMSLLQAMSVGLPAVVTDVGGMAEVVRLADCGLTAPVGDAAGLAEAIVRLAEDRALRKAMGGRGLAAYAAEFTLERMEAGYMDLYLR